MMVTCGPMVFTVCWTGTRRVVLLINIQSVLDLHATEAALRQFKGTFTNVHLAAVATGF